MDKQQKKIQANIDSIDKFATQIILNFNLLSDENGVLGQNSADNLESMNEDVSALEENIENVMAKVKKIRISLETQDGPSI